MNKLVVGTLNLSYVLQALSAGCMIHASQSPKPRTVMFSGNLMVSVGMMDFYPHKKPSSFGWNGKFGL